MRHRFRARRIEAKAEKRPLYKVAIAIHKQDNAARRRRRYKRLLDTYWSPFIIASGVIAILVVAAWPIMLLFTEGALQRLELWAELIAGVSLKDRSSLAAGAIAVPVTLPVIALGTAIAARQSYLNKLCQIADDKRKIRSQTIEHLRLTINKFRNDEQEFMADVTDLYMFGDLPSRVSVFREAVHAKARKDADSCHADDYERSLDCVLRNLRQPGTFARDHKRPIVNTKIVDLARGYYPLFSFMWGHLMNHEALGLGLARKSFGIRTLDGISGPQIVDTYLTWEAFVKSVRGIDGYRTAFRQFQWLASVIVMLRAARSAAKYYGIPIATIGEPDEHNIHWLKLAKKECFYPDINVAYYRPRTSSVLEPVMVCVAQAKNIKDYKDRLDEEINHITNNVAVRKFRAGLVS